MNRDNKVSGVMVGRVTDNRDPEGLGRVRIHLPILGDNRETDWARIATLMGGGGMGTYYIPEVGDEVLVAFHLGDVNFPYVIGSLWNHSEPPPSKAASSGNNVRMIKSKSGHEITFNDGGLGKIKIKTRAGQQIEIDEKTDNISITTAARTASIYVNGFKSSVTLLGKSFGKASVALTGKGAVQVTASKMINLTAPKIGLQAKGALSITAGTGVSIKTPGIVSIKGAAVKLN